MRRAGSDFHIIHRPVSDDGEGDVDLIHGRQLDKRCLRDDRIGDDHRFAACVGDGGVAPADVLNDARLGADFDVVAGATIPMKVTWMPPMRLDSVSWKPSEMAIPPTPRAVIRALGLMPKQESKMMLPPMIQYDGAGDIDDDARRGQWIAVAIEQALAGL